MHDPPRIVSIANSTTARFNSLDLDLDQELIIGKVRTVGIDDKTNVMQMKLLT